jgi:gamma-glutamyltranspeptidase/glutathione hydrolase
VDGEKNAVSVTYTLEAGYGSKITVPGAGFLLNNEMGDFNAGPGLTNDQGLIGTEPNLAAPKKRMLSSMTPTIVAKDGQLVLVTGSPGGRTIINTVLHTVLYTIDFQMNVQEAVDAPRFHHQWLPDRVSYEKYGFSADTLKLLEARGHTLQPIARQGMVEAIAFNPKTGLLEAGVDGRDTDGAAVGVDAPPAAAKSGGTGSR